jgi:ABC-type branched-subunit amino acid transport system ATPase component/ABC-type branched-subunit amino acid transport system permease subunit
LATNAEGEPAQWTGIGQWSDTVFHVAGHPMTFFEFGLAGLGAGAAYSLIALGVVVVYRGSGVVNFAAGAQALLAASFYYELQGPLGKWPAAIVSVLALGVVGGLIHVLIMVPLRRSSPLMRVVATVALLEAIQQAALQKYGTYPRLVPGLLPTHLVKIFGVGTTADRLIILGIALVLYVVLGVVYRRSRFGLATTGVAERAMATAALGWSPNAIAAANWMLGGMLAAVAGILLGPITGLSPDTLTLAIVPALAGCLLGEFRSFPLVLVGTLGVGVLTSEAVGHPTFIGASDAIPFLVIVAILLVRGKVLPLRSHFNERLPSIGPGVITVRRVLIFVAAPAVAISLISAPWAGAVTTAVTYGIVCLSVVIVVGYAGQLSLAQFAFVGLGALISSRLGDAGHVPFIAALPIAVIAVFPIGLLVALPAVRVRGVNLAIVTMGLGVVVSSAVLGDPDLTGGVIRGTVLPEPTLFGWNIFAPSHPERYAWVCTAILILLLLLAGNIRRSQVGHQMIAVRNNERAAASLGVSVVATKLYAFAISASIAAAAGVLLAFQVSAVTFDSYDVFASVNVIVLSVLGGVGHLSGAVFGGIAAPGSVAQSVLNLWFNIGSGIFVLITAVAVLPVLIGNPDGASAEIARQFRLVTGLVRVRLPRSGRTVSPEVEDAPSDVSPTNGPVPVESNDVGHVASDPQTSPSAGSVVLERKSFELRGVTVAYSGIVAVDDVSLHVEPGEVLGIIGPNGAGKTSLIDAATGFASLRSGEVLLDGEDLAGLSAHKRARMGLCRAFQSLELFEDLTIRENLALASSPNRWSSYVTQPFRARAPQLSPAGERAVSAFNLEAFLDRRPEGLPYGQRRLASIARAVATGPSVLLLDEPASGLDEHSAEEMALLIQRLAKDSGMSVLVIEHNLDVVITACDRVVVLEFGKVIASGSPAEVLQNPDVIAAYVGGAPEPVEVSLTRSAELCKPRHPASGGTRDGDFVTRGSNGE